MMTIITMHFTDDKTQNSDLVIEPKKLVLHEIKLDFMKQKVNCLLKDTRVS